MTPAGSRLSQPASLPLQLEFPFGTAASESPQHWRRELRRATRFWMDEARKRWRRTHFPEISLRFDLKGHAAGIACGETYSIRYNDELLQTHRQNFIEQIVPHEVAHLVVASRYPARVKPHGREWREVMDFFGVRATVTHGFKTKSARKIRKYLYACDCPQGQYFSARSHRRARSRWVFYSCRRCGAVLRYSGIFELPPENDIGRF